jgi:aspartyl protease family protein
MNGGLKIVFVLVFGLGCALFRPADGPVAPPVQAFVAPDAPEEIRLQRRGNGHFYLHGMVNGQIVEFLVDTGADSVVLTVEDAARVGLDVDKARFGVIGSGAAGPVYGQTSLLNSVEVEGRTVTNMRAMVADGLEQSLLGQDFLTRFQSVQMSGRTMILR